MTNEEKAKAYDEALKRAEAAINIAADKDLVEGVAITIFPELKESEDERIRKAIIESLPKYGYLPQTSIKVEDAIAWLEKQKEQKPITINQNEKEFLADEITAFLCNYDKEFDDEDPVPSEVAEHFYLLGKQAQEQKPAEWSEEDEAMRDNILRLLSCFVGTSECDSNPSLSTSYPAYQKEMDWLKSLKERMKGE